MSGLRSLVLWAQRRRWPVPPALRRSLRRLVEPAAASLKPVVDGWGSFAAEVPEVPASRDPAPPSSAATSEPSAQRRVRLRCLVATDGLDAGGTEEVVAFLARRLPDVGIETAVMYGGGTADARNGSNDRAALALRRAAVEVVDAARDDGRAWLARRRPDVVSAHGAPAWLLGAAGDLGIPVVETLHGMHNLFGVLPSHEAERSRLISRLVAVSELVRDQYLVRNPAFPGDRIVTIPNGLAHGQPPLDGRDAAREQLGFGPDEFVFVSLGRHCLQKNTYGLVTAFDRLAERHRHVHLVVAGRVDDLMYARQVADLRDDLACRGRVQLRDHCPRSGALLAAADAFVLDSFFEGWSLASMEALGAGLPVVLSEVGGAREQVGDGSRGSIVPNPAGDPLRVDWQAIRAARYRRQENQDALIEAMEALVEDQARWAAERELLRAEARERFSPSDWLRAHARVLVDAVSDPWPPSPSHRRPVAP